MLSEPTDLTVDILHVVFGHLPLPQYAHTLSACSLVCKTWLPVARDYLFAYLHVGVAQPEDGVMLAEKSSELVEWSGLIKPKYAVGEATSPCPSFTRAAVLAGGPRTSLYLALTLEQCTDIVCRDDRALQRCASLEVCLRELK